MTRQFKTNWISTAAAGALFWSLHAGASAADASSMAVLADTIYMGGTIVTVNDAQPSAEAVAVTGGRIVAVGSTDEVMKLKGNATTIIDLGGSTMIPGFMDAHGHMWNVGLFSVTANLLAPPDGGVDSIAVLQQTLRDWMASSAVPRQFGLIIGNGYDDGQLAEQRHPTRDELDAVSTELPVIVIHQSGHLASLNSKALELAGLTAETADPAGGLIRRREGSSEPNGVLEETAFFGSLGKLIPKLGDAEQLALLQAGQDAYVRFGQTTAQEGRALPEQIALYRKAADQGLLKIDVAVYPDIDMLKAADKLDLVKAPDWSPIYTNHFRVAGVKMNLDGSPQGKTAWLTKPYFKVPAGQKPDYVGYGTHTNEETTENIRIAFKNGWQVLAHVSGDRAIQQLIDAVRTVTDELGPADRRTVGIHSHIITETQLDSYKELGIIPAMFPMHAFYWGDWHRDSVFGPGRGENISPTGWALKRGIKFTSHHDAPVTLPNTMRVFDSTVNRVTRSGKVLGPDQRVEPIVALKAMTLWVAYQYHEENKKGSIEPGKLADFAILDQNLLTYDRTKLADIKVLKTIKEDKVVYDAAQKSAALDQPLSCFMTEKCQRSMTRAMVLVRLMHSDI